jgi:hypothetical protein
LTGTANTSGGAGAAQTSGRGSSLAAVAGRTGRSSGRDHAARTAAAAEDYGSTGTRTAGAGIDLRTTGASGGRATGTAVAAVCAFAALTADVGQCWAYNEKNGAKRQHQNPKTVAHR